MHALPLVFCFALASVESRQGTALLPPGDIVIIIVIIIPFVDLLTCLRAEKLERDTKENIKSKTDSSAKSPQLKSKERRK